MKFLVESQQQQAELPSSQALALAPQPPQRADMNNDPDNFLLVSPPRGPKKSSLMTAVSVAHSPPPLHSQSVKNAKKSRVSHPDDNPYSSLSRAFGESDDDTDNGTEDAAFVGNIDHMEVDDTVETEERIKNISIKQSKPSAVHKRTGAGRKE